MPQMMDTSTSVKPESNKQKAASGAHQQVSELDTERDLERYHLNLNFSRRRALRELDRLAEQEQERREAQYKEVVSLQYNNIAFETMAKQGR